MNCLTNWSFFSFIVKMRGHDSSLSRHSVVHARVWILNTFRFRPMPAKWQPVKLTMVCRSRFSNIWPITRCMHACPFHPDYEIFFYEIHLIQKKKSVYSMGRVSGSWTWRGGSRRLLNRVVHVCFDSICCCDCLFFCSVNVIRAQFYSCINWKYMTKSFWMHENKTVFTHVEPLY